MTLSRLIAALNSHRVGAINLTRDSWRGLQSELLPEQRGAEQVGPLHVGNVLGHPVHLSDRDSLSVWSGMHDEEVAIP